MRPQLPIQIELLQELIYLLESGVSVRDALRIFNESHSAQDSAFFKGLSVWLKQRDSGLEISNSLDIYKSSTNRNLIALIDRGLRGEAILKHLIQTQKEINELVQLKREKKLTLLPVQLLLPLLLLIFPAYLIVLLVPILAEFAQLLN